MSVCLIASDAPGLKPALGFGYNLAGDDNDVIFLQAGYFLLGTNVNYLGKIVALFDFRYCLKTEHFYIFS